MDQVFRDLPFCRCYIDDIVIWSRIMEEQLQHLEAVFKRLQDAGLKLHLGKCLFGAHNIDFHGHRISANKLEPQLLRLEWNERRSFRESTSINI